MQKAAFCYCPPHIPMRVRGNITKTLMVMKLTVFLLGLCLHVTATTVSQTITLSTRGSEIKKVFIAVEKQTGYTVFCNKELLQNTTPVSISVRNMELVDFLQTVLKDQPIGFYIENKTIVIRRKPVFGAPAPETVAEVPLIEIRGRVLGENGEPVDGASINVKGTNIGTTTDANGFFTINTDINRTLVISYVGYESVEMVIRNQELINITLRLSADNINEQVVVTGYTAQRKKDITGSVAIVDMKALKSIPSGSPAQALQGQASGVNVISPGMPGASSNIFIRGVSSFGNTQPLIIIDGIQGDIKDLNAEDIESMQVLKDAGAASIYGVRGSNGVIVITTKKGKSGAPVLTYDAYVGVQMPLSGNPFNILNAEDYARLTKIATPGTALFANGLPDYVYRGPSGSGTGMEGDPAVDPSRYRFDPTDPAGNYIIQKVNKQGTNWFQEVFSPALITNHNLTASGGTDRSKYLFSVGYFDQQGTLLNTYLKRYSARINTEYKVTKNIRIGENAYVFYRQNPGFGNQSQGNAISQAYRMMPIIPVYDIAGNLGGTFGGPGLGNASSPVAIQKRSDNDRNNAWNVIGNLYAEVDFLKRFTARTSFGGTIDNRYIIDFTYNNYNNSEGNTNLNSLTENALYNSSTMWTNTVNYGNVFGKHDVKATVGSEAIRNYGRSLTGRSDQLFSTDFDYLSLTNGTTNVTANSTAYINTLFSLFGRLDYTYNDKYLLAVTVRRDGSSRFGSEKRYGVFPSVSLGWRVTSEKFMENVNWLNDLKVRGSYGVLGSEINVNPANAFSLYGGSFSTSYYDIAGTSNTVQQGFYQTRLGNPLTSWEENIISNVGFDATLFNRLNVSVEYYKKSINGLLFSQPLPFTAGGATAPIINIGDIKNTGVDIAVGYRANLSSDLQLSIGANITTYKNVVVDIPDPGYFDVASGLSFGNQVRNQEGQPVSAFFGYEVIGLFRDDADVTASPTQNGAAPGRFKYRDVDGDKAITAADRTFIGDPNPDFTYGLNLGLNYKNFDFATVFYGSQGNDVINTVRNLTDFFGTFVGGKSRVLLNAWTPENLDTNIPKVEGTNSFSTSGAVNSYYMENGSYLRLRSLVLGYTLKPAFLQRVGLNKLRVYAQGANLFTITKYSGLDPELSGSSQSFGVDYGNYPNNQRNFLLGLNVTF